jgi:chemotaxis protein CheZ
MTAEIDMRAEWGELFGALAHAFATGNRADFVEILDRLSDKRNQSLFKDVRDASDRLRSALDQFQLNSRLATLAGKEVPDARLRLDHALKITEEGAHKTLDLVEQSYPLAEKVAKQASSLVKTLQNAGDGVAHRIAADLLPGIKEFLATAQSDSEAVRANLTEVLMAQSAQDLSGQIIRGVITLVGEVERTLGQLTTLTGGKPAEATAASNQGSTSQGFGPAVPGITKGAVSEQNDVDALLADLGM